MLRSGQRCKLIRSGWAIRVKPAGRIRARIVATEVSDWSHPNENYIPTPREVSHKIVMARAIHRGWHIKLGDVSAAFLHALLSQDSVQVIVVPPKSETLDNPDELWLVRKALYGLRRSPKDFNEFFARVMTDIGWRRLESDPQLFVNDRFEGALLSVHTDGILVTAADKNLEVIKAETSKLLTLKWPGVLGTSWTRFWGSTGEGVASFCRSVCHTGTSTGCFWNRSLNAVKLQPRPSSI
jgi:hypothetical protein